MYVFKGNLWKSKRRLLTYVVRLDWPKFEQSAVDGIGKDLWIQSRVHNRNHSRHNYRHILPHYHLLLHSCQRCHLHIRWHIACDCVLMKYKILVYFEVGFAIKFVYLLPRSLPRLPQYKQIESSTYRMRVVWNININILHYIWIWRTVVLVKKSPIPLKESG